MTMPAGLSVEDLIAYTGWQRAQWLAALRSHPEALQLSAGPHGDGRFSTVGDLVKHVFGAEQRYVQRLESLPLSDFTSVPSDDLEALAAIGDAARRDLVRLLATYPADAWETPRQFRILDYDVTATPRKIVVHVLVHEIRHWAQIATICRLNGAPTGFQDFLASPVWGGGFASA